MTRSFTFGSTTPTTTPPLPTTTLFGRSSEVTTRPRSITLYSAEDIASTLELYPNTVQSKNIKFMLDTWLVLLKALLENNADLNKDIIDDFINKDHIPNAVLSRLSNRNWGQIFNQYPRTKSIILNGCGTHINGDDYSNILYEAFEVNNIHCPIELLRDIKKYLWIKKIYEEHPSIFCPEAKKEFNLES